MDNQSGGEATHDRQTSRSRADRRGKPARSWWTNLLESTFYLACVVCVILLVRGCTGYGKQKPAIEISGRTIEGGLFTNNQFELFLWHQNPGTLRNGRIDVMVSGAQLETRKGSTHVSKTHSFDAWAPNESSRLSFEFPLKSVGEQVDLHVHVRVAAKDMLDFEEHSHWKGRHWQ